MERGDSGRRPGGRAHAAWRLDAWAAVRATTGRAGARFRRVRREQRHLGFGRRDRQPLLRRAPGSGETSLHISATDCATLGATVHRQTGATLRRISDPTPPNSHCQLQGPGVHVSVSLDAAHAARTSYSNRIDEQVQFNAADPAKVPHPVPGVGDKDAYNQNASWIPAYSTLWAVRGNRWLTVVYSVAGETRVQRLAAAAPLARRAFRLTAR